MFVLQITDNNSNAPASAFTENCPVLAQLHELVGDDRFHMDESCDLSTEYAYYVWAHEEGKLENLWNQIETNGEFFQIITDDPDHLGMPVEIPEGLEVLPLK